jgi:membrane glycosyltransferase
LCERWGNLHDYGLVLDAEILMSTGAVIRLVRTMRRTRY